MIIIFCVCLPIAYLSFKNQDSKKWLAVAILTDVKQLSRAFGGFYFVLRVDVNNFVSIP